MCSSSHSKAQGAFLLHNVNSQLYVTLHVIYPSLFYSFAGGRWLEIRSYGDRQSISLGIYNHLCVWDCRALYPATNSRGITLSTPFYPLLLLFHFWLEFYLLFLSSNITPLLTTSSAPGHREIQKNVCVYTYVWNQTDLKHFHHIWRQTDLTLKYGYHVIHTFENYVLLKSLKISLICLLHFHGTEVCFTSWWWVPRPWWASVGFPSHISHQVNSDPSPQVLLWKLASWAQT